MSSPLSYLRQKRASILIGVGGGSGLEACCLVSNMSQIATYISSLVLDLETAEKTFSHPVTELADLEEWSRPTDLDLWTRQGPLAPGERPGHGGHSTPCSAMPFGPSRPAVQSRAIMEWTPSSAYG